MLNDLPTIRVYIAAPGQTDFTYPFRPFDVDYIAVEVDGVAFSRTAPGGGVGTWSTVSDENTEGGTIKLGAACVGGEQIILRRQLVRERISNFPAVGPVPNSTLDRQFDYQLAILQEIADANLDFGNRAVLVPVGEGGIMLPAALDRANGFFSFDAVGSFLLSTGTGNDPNLRTDLALSTGMQIIAFLQAGGSAAQLRTALAKARERVTVTDFGAIGDGTSHPVSEWLVGGARDRGFLNLAAIQAAYPDVRTLADECDFAAINACVRYAVASGKATRIPAGTYLGWIYAHFDDVVILGDGSSVTKIKLPDGALRDTPNNNDGSGPMVNGVPNVVDFNTIGHGNDATPMSGGHISGLTLDGNVDNTDVPDEDLHGWGLAFTAYSDVSYHDIVVCNTHCGGVGTFINSNYHIGSCRTFNCGHSNVDGATRPGFDVNSSKYSVWHHVGKDDAYGFRMIDNCFGNKVTTTIFNATRTGVVYGNQSVNLSHSNVIHATVNGGCLDQGMVVGGDCSGTSVSVVVQGIAGDGFRSVAQGVPADDSRSNNYNISTRRCGGKSAYIQGSNDIYTIASCEDGRTGAQGGTFAVDVEGDKNILTVALTDTSPWQVRGIAFRATASDNKLLAYTWTNTADAFIDQGVDNIWRDRTPIWTAPTLLNSFANVGGDYFTAGYYKDADGWVHLRGLVNGGTAGNQIFVLPAGFRPLKNWIAAFGGGSGAGGVYKLQIGLGGDVVPQGGADFFALDGISFPTKS